MFRTLETVAVETPARLAISFTDALDFLPNDCFYRELGTTAFLYRGIIEWLPNNADLTRAEEVQKLLPWNVLEECIAK